MSEKTSFFLCVSQYCGLLCYFVEPSLTLRVHRIILEEVGLQFGWVVDFTHVSEPHL